MRETLTRWFDRQRALKWVVYRVFYAAWSWTLAAAEAAYWTLARPAQSRQARDKWDHLFAHPGGLDCLTLWNWYRAEGFTWYSDPWGGRLDFRSRPWVAIAKNHGDCDDMAELAFSVLTAYQAVELVCVAAAPGGHAVCLAFTLATGQWWAMNNDSAQGPFSTRAEALFSALYTRPWLTVTIKRKEA